MKQVPNNLITQLCRYLPMFIDNLDKSSVQKSLRLTNAVRVAKHEILPKLNKIDKIKNDTTK